MNTQNPQIRITLAGVAGVLFMLASDPQVQALFVAPYGMLMAKAAAAAVASGVFYSMNSNVPPKP